MTGHVHYDLAEVERTIRASAEAGFTDALAAATDESQRRFVELQQDLANMQIEATLWAARCGNRGADGEMVLQAMGRALGNIIHDFCRTFPDQASVMAGMAEIIADTLSADAEDLAAAAIAADESLAAKCRAFLDATQPEIAR